MIYKLKHNGSPAQGVLKKTNGKYTQSQDATKETAASKAQITNKYYTCTPIQRIGCFHQS